MIKWAHTVGLGEARNCTFSALCLKIDLSYKRRIKSLVKKHLCKFHFNQTLNLSFCSFCIVE